MLDDNKIMKNWQKKREIVHFGIIYEIEELKWRQLIRLSTPEVESWNNNVWRAHKELNAL